VAIELAAIPCSPAPLFLVGTCEARLQMHPRRVLSAAAGVSVAYVFIRASPALRFTAARLQSVAVAALSIATDKLDRT
jgi:hypothetical protein